MSLDEAWAEAESALPEGWTLFSLSNGHEDDHGYYPEAEWRAAACRFVHQEYIPGRQSEQTVAVDAKEATGSTPAAALSALAVALRDAANRLGEALG